MESLAVVRRCLFFTAMPMVFLSFALPLQARDLGASALNIGGLFSIFTVALLVIRPLVGFGLDIFGRRRFFLGALLAYFVANVVFSLQDGMAWLYIARLLQGIGAAMLLITTDAITADLSNQSDRGSLMGRNIESMSRGGMVGAFVGFTLVGAIPVLAWQGSFLLYGFFALVALVFAYRYLPESVVPIHNIRRPVFDLFGPIREHRGLQLLGVVIFISAFANALIQPLYLIYLKEKFDVSMMVLAWAFLPAGIIYSILPSRLGALSDRYGRSVVMAVGLTLAATVYLLLPWLPGLLIVAVAYTLGHVGWALADPARSAWVGDQCREDNRGQTFGATEMIGSLGATIGPLIGGYLYDISGDVVVFSANAGLLIIAAALAYFLPRLVPDMAS